jgi:type IX secretion system PorP/SprF family membrane protein
MLNKVDMKNISRINRILLALPAMIMMLAGYNANAQHEPMFTQYMFNETFINPAYAGSHETQAISGLYRNQWVGIEGSPKTQTLSFHTPIAKRKLGLGVSLMNESIGVSNQMLVSAQFAYRILMPRSVLTFGTSTGFVNDQETLTKVVTTVGGDNQFATDIHKYFMPNAGFGIYYYYQKKFYVGFSIPRLLENKVNAYSSGLSTNIGNPSIWHYYFATGYVFQCGDNVKFKPSIMVKAVNNAPLEMDVNANWLFNEFLWLGASYRTNDAISGMLGIQISKQLRVSYSYDYSISPLQQYNSGSHEISVGYDFSSLRHRVVSPRYF